MNETTQIKGLPMVKEVQAMKVIFLTSEPTLKLGSSYKSDIFFQHRQKIKPEHGMFFFEHHELIYEDLTALKRQILDYGEELIIEDLHIIYLRSVLCLYANIGDLRVAFRDRRRALDE